LAKQAQEIREQASVLRRTYDSVRCRAVIATLARNHTWVTPTLVVYQPYAHAIDSATTHPEWAKYVPGIIQGGRIGRAHSLTLGDSMSMRSYFSFDRTGELNKAGVQLLTGTNAPQPFV